MPDFSRRTMTPELMDTEATDFETFRDCLVDLERVNRLTFAYRPTLAFLDRLEREKLLPKDRPLRILDAGSGYGDMLRQVYHWGRRRRVALRMTGIDFNPWSARAAGEASPADMPVEWRTADIFAPTDGPAPDLVISSLFTHHLDDATLVRFLAWMEARATIGWFVNDLHRHALPYHVFANASRALRMHRFVTHDGPVSIARAFRKPDWHERLAEAGIAPEAAEVAWWMPFRLCVSRVRRP